MTRFPGTSGCSRDRKLYDAIIAVTRLGLSNSRLEGINEVVCDPRSCVSLGCA
jgi:hypothetical protein